jgi:uncharacterized membrane protein HdeD (DUF308 family)
MGKTFNIVIGHILLIVGIWQFSRGLIYNPVRPALLHPIFWGLILVFAGICCMKAGDCKCECNDKKKRR